MSNRILRAFYSLFFIPGMMTGISIKTGVDVSEFGIASLILETFCKVLQSPACVFPPILSLVGILMTIIPFAYFFFTENIFGLILGILFFISGLLLVFIPNIAVFIFLFSVLTLIIYPEGVSI